MSKKKAVIKTAKKIVPKIIEEAPPCEKLYEECDVYKFRESLKFRPETYRTILLERFNNKNTETNKVRKKISAFVRQGYIASGLLDGESGTKIFYSLEKTYYIFIVKAKREYKYYYCSTVEENDKNEVILFNAFILGKYDWKYLGNIGLPKTTIQRWW